MNLTQTSHKALIDHEIPDLSYHCLLYHFTMVNHDLLDATIVVLIEHITSYPTPILTRLHFSDKLSHSLLIGYLNMNCINLSTLRTNYINP